MRLLLRPFPAVGELLLFALLCAAMVDVATANAATRIVTNTNDSGPGSLRDVIAAASDGDTIQFNPGLNGQIMSLVTHELVIDKDITISGPGPNRFAVQSAIFDVASGHTVTIEGLLIRFGRISNLNTDSSLTVNNCIVRDNLSRSDGGGISNAGTLTITNTIISNNEASNPILHFSRGGGIFNSGTLTIINSTITGNFAEISGGGICNTGMATISDSTVSDNNQANLGSIPPTGGGISNDAANATMEIVNTTISRNHAYSSGSGVNNVGTLTIINSTLSDNQTNGDGGGIHNTNTLDISNTILKTGSSGANLSNNGGTIASHGYNISNDDGAGFLTATGDQINADPMLGPLQNNGGPTFTYALLDGSPAIDAGNPDFTPPPLTDQRGYARVYNGRIDIGSLEVQPSPAPTPTPTQAPFPAQALNISTRLRIESGNNVMIGGFIVTGNALKNVAVRGLGPSLAAFGISGVLADPTLKLYNAGGVVLSQNNDWQDGFEGVQLSALGLALNDFREAGLVTVLPSPASYTVILSDYNLGSGVGLLELYDVDPPQTGSQLANISTRGFVQTGDNVMIGGFILGGSSNDSGIVVRGIGPTLAQFGLSNVLADPTLELHNSNGVLLVANDNWQDDPVSAAQLIAHGLAPQNPLESGIFASLPPGAFAAILAGKNGGTGVGLVEIYNVN